MSDNITLPREVVKLALDALHYAARPPARDDLYAKEIAILRTALAAEPTKPEPVAWQERHFFPRVGEWTGWDDCRPIMADYPREQIDQNGVRYQWRPLYTAPPDAEALRRDAERYRWLKAKVEDYDGHACFPQVPYPAPIPDRSPFDAVDAAIDAAMGEKR